jgi:formate hydrogenlyase subunit 3/multisubunit Na+/H+ antiporter MnhD subunit
MLDSLYPLFKLDKLNGFIIIAIVFFTALTIIYSLGFMKGKSRLIQYYTYVILTAIVSIGAVTANNLILLLICWGFIGLTLYLLVGMGDSKSAAAAKKTMVIVGGSDALMLFGIAIIYYLTGTLQMDSIKIDLAAKGSFLGVIAFLSILIACFAKAGAMPVHSWIPDVAESAPVPVVAFLPASLDKLLGIYLLARISIDLFLMNKALNILLMLIGAFTIIAAVMMALFQHNMKRLLGYHAVSQVGYMVLGIGTGVPLGIAAGLFHMLNHALYKSCLFFTAGNVEYRAKTTELNELGGLGKLMPITYICCMIASLSISGVPPFNGFVSKWMLYQGIIQGFSGSRSPAASVIGIFCLVAAMFGSGLTLASFMKLIHAAFLGQLTARGNKLAVRDEVPVAMWLPISILAVICVVFGVFASQIPLRYFIFPAIEGVSFIGTWQAGLSTFLVLTGLLFGIAVFKLKKSSFSLRQDTAYIGGATDEVNLSRDRVSGLDFYNTVKEYGIIKLIYKKAESGVFDIYEQTKILLSGTGKFLGYLHNGVLPTYLVWGLLGMAGLLAVLLR